MELKFILESILFSAQKPLSPAEIRDVFAKAAAEEDADASILPLLARKPVFVPANLPLDRLLSLFHEEKTRLLFLVDEYGGVDGIVTLSDVIDELLDDPRQTTSDKPPG